MVQKNSFFFAVVGEEIYGTKKQWFTVYDMQLLLAFHDDDDGSSG
jgi:hypothetical protein